MPVQMTSGLKLYIGAIAETTHGATGKKAERRASERHPDEIFEDGLFQFFNIFFFTYLTTLPSLQLLVKIRGCYINSFHEDRVGDMEGDQVGQCSQFGKRIPCQSLQLVKW